MTGPVPPDGSAPGYFGVYPAIVTRIVDPESLGRIEVRFPTLGDEGNRDVRAWATLCSPYADADQGLQVLPEVDSQVVVAFEAGNMRRPYIVGACWNGRETPPRPADAANNLRVLRSRAESEIEFDDTQDASKLTITTASGHRVVLDDGRSEVTIRHANGSVVKFTAAGAIEIQANTTVDVKAIAVNVTAPISTFSGIVRCQTLQADTFVISPAYTPGVGNLL